MDLTIGKTAHPIMLAEGDNNETWLHLFTAGHFLKGTFKEFSINEKDFDSMIGKYRRRLSEEKTEFVPIDYNHASIYSMGGDSKAAGWVVGASNALKKRKKGKELWARVTLTKKARKEIKNGEWKRISPEFIPRKSLFDDRERTPELLAVALTNRPATNLEPIDSTKLSGYNISDQPFNQEEDTMTADEIRAILKEEMQPFSVRLSNLENPQGQMQAGIQGAGMIDTDELGKAVALAVGTAVEKQIAPISTKLSEFEEQRNRDARERLINKTLSKHVERGAVTPEQVSAVREMLMLTKDDEAFGIALKAQDALFSAIPSKKKDGEGDEETTATKTGGDGGPDKPMINLGEDGDIADNSVSFVPVNQIQGTGQADTTVLSIQKFVDTKKAEGVNEVEALELAHAKFGDDKFAEYAQTDEGGFGDGAIAV